MTDLDHMHNSFVSIQTQRNMKSTDTQLETLLTEGTPACSEGAAFARQAGSIEAAWQTTNRGDWLIRYLRKSKPALPHQFWPRLALWCARQVQDIMADPRSIRALDITEAYLNGTETIENLYEARRDAYAADAAAAAYAAAADAVQSAQAAYIRSQFNPFV